MKLLYYTLSLFGTFIPLLFFFPWLLEHGLALGLLVKNITITPISSFAWADVLISGIVLLVFIKQETKNYNIPHYWISIISLFIVGVSLAFPLFLALRESRTQK